MSISTLILGHMRHYEPHLISCSPIDTNLWINDNFTCVDYHCNKDSTDIVYDLFNSIDYRFCKSSTFSKEDAIKYEGHWVWKFAENNSYDRIIDCIGNMHWDKSSGNPDTFKYKHHDELLKTILRILKPDGKFYSPFGIYTKISNTELVFEKKERNGYQYI